MKNEENVLKKPAGKLRNISSRWFKENQSAEY
jgi:hypothetical protein